MVKFALFDEEGFPAAFYSADIHGDTIPAEAVEITDEQWHDFLENTGRRRWQDGEVVSYDPPPVSLTVEDFQRAIQAHVDAIAVSKLYNDGATLAGYTSSTVPQWAADAAAFVAWRDAVWIYAYGELDKVTAAEREVPTIEDFIAELPVIEWPA